MKKIIREGLVMCDYPGCNGDGEETYFGLTLCDKHRNLMQFVTDLFARISINIEES